MKKTALEYRRLRNVRGDVGCDTGGCTSERSDLAETANPRYQQGITVSHTRGQQRMGRWVRYK